MFALFSLTLNDLRMIDVEDADGSFRPEMNESEKEDWKGDKKKREKMSESGSSWLTIEGGTGKVEVWEYWPAVKS